MHAFERGLLMLSYIPDKDKLPGNDNPYCCLVCHYVLKIRALKVNHGNQNQL